jgi:hypothetical protein
MKDYARNLAVGLTVIVALVLLGVLIVIFAVLPTVFRGGYPVVMNVRTSGDIHEGDPVHMAGVRIGYVTDRAFRDPHHPERGVRVTALIDEHIHLPANVRVHVFTKGLTGQPYIELKPDGPPRLGPGGRKLEYFPRDGSMTLSVVRRGSSMIPEELLRLLRSLRDSFAGLEDLGKLARTLNEIIAPPPAEQPTPAAAATAPATAPRPRGLRAALAKLDRTLDGLAALVGDPNNQANFKASLANLAEASARATEAMTAVRQFAQQARDTTAASEKKLARMMGKFIDSADALTGVLASARQAVSRVADGEGTAGKLINDPKLYNNLLEVTRQLNQLVKDFRHLVETWKASGVKIKLG